MIDATEDCELLDRGYVQIGGCSCTYPMCVKCQVASDFIDEIERLRAQVQRVEAVTHLVSASSTAFGDGWVEAMGFVTSALRGTE